MFAILCYLGAICSILKFKSGEKMAFINCHFAAHLKYVSIILRIITLYTNIYMMNIYVYNNKLYLFL
jgi:hypothetical protein